MEWLGGWKLEIQAAGDLISDEIVGWSTVDQAH